MGSRSHQGSSKTQESICPVEVSPKMAKTIADDLTSKTLFPGDRVVFQAKFLQDLVPNFGIVLDANNPLVVHMRGGKPSNFLGKEQGGSHFVVWERSQQVQQVRRQELSLVDRPLQRGQIIRNRDGLKGVVIDLTVNTTLQLFGNNKIIENVPIQKLYPFTTYVRGQEILYKGWVGTITAVKRRLHFQLQSGSVLYLESDETDGFMNNDPYWGTGAQCPGTHIKLPPSALRKAKLVNPGLKGLFWKWPGVAELYSLYDTLTVLTPQVVGISVDWLTPDPFEDGKSTDPPPNYLDESTFREAVPIGLPSSETMQPSSVRVYNIQPNDKLKDNLTWFKEFHDRHMSIGTTKQVPAAANTVRIQKQNPGAGHKVTVVVRQTKVEVQWEDGSTGKMMAADVPYIYPFDEDSPCRGGLVVATAFPPTESIYGIVHPSQSDYKMVNVRWVQIPEETEDENESTIDLGVKEESIYDIRPHPEYSMYNRGTVVFLKEEVRGIKAGTVVDLDLRIGKMLIATPGQQDPVTVWPHMVQPLTKRCYWNFFSKKWIINNLLPPTYQIEVPFEVEEQLAGREPIVISPNNNNILDTLDSSLRDEPQFAILDHAPKSHYFYKYEPQKLKYLRNYLHDGKFLKESTPEGVWIRAYENRMDLLSVLYLGPQNTPYEDGLYMFDLQLPRDFPEVPPKIKYISFSESISHLIDHYDGEFCMGSLNWNKMKRRSSSILTAVERIQSVLFHSEPFFDVYHINRDSTTPQNLERSRAFNEKIFINVLSSLYNMAQRPHDPWRRHITEQLSLMLPHKVKFLKKILDQDVDVFDSRNYPLFPVTKAFETSLTLRVAKLEALLHQNQVQISQTESEVKSLELKVVDSFEIMDKKESTSITEIIPPKDSENNIKRKRAEAKGESSAEDDEDEAQSSRSAKEKLAGKSHLSNIDRNTSEEKLHKKEILRSFPPSLH